MDELGREEPSPRRLSARLAILGAIALAGVAAASAWLTRDSWGRPVGPSAASSASATSSPAFAVHAPPPDVPLLWSSVESSLSELHLRAFDWSGREVGTLAPRCLAPCTFFASPDGRRLLIAARSEPSPAEVVDTTGARLGSLQDVGGLSWAADSRHLCGVSGPGGTTFGPAPSSRVELALVDPAGGSRRVVTTVAWGSPAASTSFSYVETFCTTQSDRAVVVLLDGQPGGVRAVRVIALSTGRDVYAHDDTPPAGGCGCSIDSVAVSGAGRMLVENLAGGGVRMRDTATGTVIAHSDGMRVVDGLSWNGRLAVVSNGVTTNGVIDLLTSATVWSAPPLTHALVRAARPGGDDLLLDVTSTVAPQTATEQLIVHPDGRTDHLPGGVSI